MQNKGLQVFLCYETRNCFDLSPEKQGFSQIIYQFSRAEHIAQRRYLKADYSNGMVCHHNDEGVAVRIQALCDYTQAQYDQGLGMPIVNTEEAA